MAKEQQQTERKSIDREFEAPSDKDMDVVPWIFSKMILLYIELIKIMSQH